MRRLSVSMNKKHFTKHNLFPKKKRQLLLATLLRKLPLKSSAQSCLRKPYLKIGKSHYLVCKSAIKLFKRLRSSSNKRKMKSCKLSQKLTVSETKPARSKKHQMTYTKSFRKLSGSLKFFNREKLIQRLTKNI